MRTAGTFPGVAARADGTSAAPIQRRQQATAMAAVSIGNTLHCSSDVVGSAAQFNQSVSAMPCCVPNHINAPRQGTADTLSKR
jgi:hypothetical protein